MFQQACCIMGFLPKNKYRKFYLAVAWVGVFDGVGFHPQGHLWNLSGLPTAIGLYAFCFCGHAVFPSIYSSMKDRRQFSQQWAYNNHLYYVTELCCSLINFRSIYFMLLWNSRLTLSNHTVLQVLILCSVVCTLIYGSIAVMGYMMFGNKLESQVTLNLPRTLVASKVAIYITILWHLYFFFKTVIAMDTATAIFFKISQPWIQRRLSVDTATDQRGYRDG